MSYTINTEGWQNLIIFVHDVYLRLWIPVLRSQSTPQEPGINNMKEEPFLILSLLLLLKQAWSSDCWLTDWLTLLLRCTLSLQPWSSPIITVTFHTPEVWSSISQTRTKCACKNWSQIHDHLKVAPYLPHFKGSINVQASVESLILYTRHLH